MHDALALDNNNPLAPKSEKDPEANAYKVSSVATKLNTALELSLNDPAPWASLTVVDDAE